MNMKKIVVLLSILVCGKAYSQSIVDSLGNAAFTMTDTIGEKLADLAVTNPNIEMIEKQLKAAKFDVRYAKGTWLNAFTAAFNVNEFSLKQNSSDVNRYNTLYPRYNFGLQVPLGLFFTKGAQVNKAKAVQEEASAKLSAEKLRIRQAVLNAYQEYLLNKYLLAIEESVLQDEQVVYKQAEQKFKDNAIRLEAFTDATRRYNAAVSKRLTLLRDFNNAKTALEIMIGMDLPSAIAQVTGAVPTTPAVNP